MLSFIGRYSPVSGIKYTVLLRDRALQTDPEIRKQLRPDYDKDTKQLIMSAQVIAIEFQTIAAANNYWRDK